MAVSTVNLCRGIARSKNFKFQSAFVGIYAPQIERTAKHIRRHMSPRTLDKYTTARRYLENNRILLYNTVIHTAALFNSQLLVGMTCN